MSWNWTFVIILLKIITDRGESVFLEKYLYGTSNTKSIWINVNTVNWLQGITNQPTVQFVPVGSSKQHQYLGCSYHKHRDFLVLNDVGVGSITAIGNSSNQLQISIAYIGTSHGVKHIDVDWLSGNVYWSDSTFGWIAVQKLPLTFSGFSLANHFKVIVDTHLDVPSGVATDPSQRFLFWTDTGKQPKLERSNLDGQSRVILVWSGLFKPVTLIIDVRDKFLYWADTAKGTVESSDYYGRNRKILVTDPNSQFYGLALYQNHIITTVPIAKSLKVYSTDSGKETRDVSFQATQPYSVCMVTEENQPTTAGICDPDSCEHICMKTATGTKCICEDGFKLTDNGKNCIAKTDVLERSFIFTKGSKICAFPTTHITGHKFYTVKPNCDVAASPLGDVIHLVVDAARNELFFTVSEKIYRQNFFEASAIKIFSTKAKEKIEGLAYDWINEMLYWIEESYIYKWHVDQNRQISISGEEIITRNIISPRSVIVDPFGKRLYWLSGTTSAGIEYVDLTNTTNREMIVQNNVVSPHYLTYSRNLQRLFWVGEGQIGNVKTDGTGLNVKKLTSARTYRGIAVYKDYLMWIAMEASKSLITFQDRSTEELRSATFTLDETKPAYSLIIFDKATQPDKKEQCVYGNSGCSQMCLTDVIGSRCKCEHGYTLQSDEKTCKTNIVESNFFLVIDNLGNRIYQIEKDSWATSAVSILVSNQPTTLTVDTSDNLLYWTDVKSNSVKVSFLNGTEERTFANTGASTSQAVAIDQSSGNIYFVKDNSIAVISKDGSKVKTDIVRGVSSVQSLTLHPKQGKMYWIENGPKPVIKEADMDGSQDNVLVKSDIKSPTDISLDKTDNAMFWCDSKVDKIEKINLQNRKRTILQENTGEKPISIGLDESYVFYVNYNRRSITRINKGNGGGAKVVFTSTDIGRLSFLYIHQRSFQVHPVCSVNNGCCSQFCLPKKSLRKCACSGDTNLNDDGKTCAGGIDKGTVSRTVQTVADALCNKKDVLLKWPTADQARQTKIKLYQLGGFPNVIGLLDGTHIRIQAPHEDEASYINRKGYHSVNVQAVCDADESFCPKVITNAKEPIGCLKCTGQVHADSECGFSCQDGFVNKQNVTTVQCSNIGHWKQDVSHLCIKICDGNVKNGQMDPGCSRETGTNCRFSCREGFKSSRDTVRCQSDGRWENSDSACEKILCSVSLSNGQYVSPCTGEVGVSCGISCSTGHTSFVASAICLATGKWDKEAVCTLTGNGQSQLGQYVGFATGGLLILIIGVTIVMCVLIRKSKKDQVDSHNPPAIPFQTVSSSVAEKYKEDGEIYTQIDEGAVGGINYVCEESCNPKSSPNLMPRRQSTERYTEFPSELDYQPLDQSVRSNTFTDYHSLHDSRTHSLYVGNDNYTKDPHHPGNATCSRSYDDDNSMRNEYHDEKLAYDYIHQMTKKYRADSQEDDGIYTPMDQGVVGGISCGYQESCNPKSSSNFMPRRQSTERYSEFPFDSDYLPMNQSVRSDTFTDNRSLGSSRTYSLFTGNGNYTDHSGNTTHSRRWSYDKDNSMENDYEDDNFAHDYIHPM